MTDRPTRHTITPPGLPNGWPLAWLASNMSMKTLLAVYPSAAHTMHSLAPPQPDTPTAPKPADTPTTDPVSPPVEAPAGPERPVPTPTASAWQSSRNGVA